VDMTIYRLKCRLKFQSIFSRPIERWVRSTFDSPSRQKHPTTVCLRSVYISEFWMVYWYVVVPLSASPCW
jgi:hypothetical protein